MRAFLLIFQQRRKKIRQGRAPLLPYFPIEKKGGATKEAGALLHCFPLPNTPSKKKKLARRPASPRPALDLRPPFTFRHAPITASPDESRAARRAGLDAKHGGAAAVKSVLALFQRAWPPLFIPPPSRARFPPKPSAFSFGAAQSPSIGFVIWLRALRREPLPRKPHPNASPRRARRRPVDGGP